MTRTSVLIALVLTVTGAMLFANGPSGVVRMAAMLGASAHVIILALAGLALVLNVAPRGTLAGPLTLAIIGMVAYLTSRSLWSPAVWELLGGIMMLAGGWLIMTLSVDKDSVDPVKYATATAFPRRIRFTAEDKVPAQLYVRAVGTRIRLDLSSAAPPRLATIQIFITCLAGRVELTLPKSWPALAGRVSSTWRIHFEGELDTQEPSPHPFEGAEPERLQGIVDARKTNLEIEESARSAAVVLHVAGAGGTIVLVGR